MLSASAQDLWSLAPRDQPAQTPTRDSLSLSPSDLSPAWDPSSRTPLLFPGSPLAASSSASTLQEELPRHVLLSPHLVGVPLRVIVDGGQYEKQELSATITNVDGCLQICHTVYKTSHILQPVWVSPKHPNPTRDKGLLVVIEGEHCGKYVRRVHQRSDDDNFLLYLAVVTRVNGSADRVSDERLELGVTGLCVCAESNAERKLNKNLMDSLRNDARLSAGR